MLETLGDEIAPEIYRLSTYVEPANLVFNHYLVVAEEPLLFHCGGRRLFPLVRSAVERVMPPANLRWISFGHVESDEPPDTAPTIRRLADMRPSRLALMHGPAFAGDAHAALAELARSYDHKLRAALDMPGRSG
jgi:flavorubredoxin